MCTPFSPTKPWGVYPRKKIQKCVIINLESKVEIKCVHTGSHRVISMDNIKTVVLTQLIDSTY